MKRWLSLVLASILTGAPTLAAEFEVRSFEGPRSRVAPLSPAVIMGLSPELDARAADLDAAAISGTPLSSTYAPSGAAIETALERAASAASPSREVSPQMQLTDMSARDGDAVPQVIDGIKDSRRGGEPSVFAGASDAAGGASGLGRWTGGRRRRGGMGSDWGGGGGGSNGGGGRGDDEGPALRAWNWVKSLPQGVKIGAAVVLLAGGALYGFYQHSKAWNDYWLKSKSQHQIVQIDDSRKRGDASTLLEVAQAAQARQQRMNDRIAEAKRLKQKTVNDSTHDKLDEAEHLAAFDGLVWSRARLNHNFVSEDADKRIGEQAPRRWASGELELEQDAVSSGFEGKLALSLQNLRREVEREKAKAGSIEGELKNFDDHVPYIFGGVMANESKKGRADLKEFRDKEIAPEDALWTAKNAAMRGRVSERLYKESADFHGHRDHRDALTALFDAKVDPAYRTARRIDEDLGSMISHRDSEASWMAIAAMHTHDAVQHSETTYDSKGRSHTRYWTTYEDHSGTYRALAAIEASAAASAARSANDGLSRLKPMIAALYADRMISREDLTKLLPRAEGQSVGEGGFSVFSDLFFHPMFGIFGGLSSASSGQHARSSFGPVLSALRSLDNEVAGRRDGEVRWVEGQITSDLDAQMERAKTGTGGY